MTIRYSSAIVNPGIRYVRLGYLTPFDGAYTLTVGDRTGGNKRGLKLTPAYFNLVNSLDPTVGAREFSAEELGLLGWMADQGFIFLIKSDAALKDFDMIPVPRREIAFVEDLDEGYLVQIGDGETFPVSELGARFLPLVDGERTLGEIAEAVKEDILADPEEALTVLQIEEEQGRPFASFLADEALILIRDFTKSGAITFEPKA
jgi:hypothetical protein